METFGSRLKYFIDNYYTSKIDFGIDCGISQTSISQYIHGSSKPKHEKLVDIGDIGVNLSWLLNGKGFPLNIDVVNDMNFNPNIVIPFKDSVQNHANLLKWVLKYYGDFPTFYSMLSESDEQNMKRIVENRHLLNHKALNCLRNKGCNIIWLLTGNGEDVIESEATIHLIEAKKVLNGCEGK